MNVNTGIENLENIKNAFLDFPELINSIDTSIELLKTRLDVNKDHYVTRVLRRIGVSFSQLDEALSRSKKGDIIIFVQGTYQVFSTETEYNNYISNIIVNKKIDTVPHYQIIRDQDTQKLVFIHEDATEQELPRMKDFILKHFKNIGPEDIIFLDNKDNDDISVMLSSILGTGPQNRERVETFKKYIRLYDRVLNRKILPIQPDSGVIKILLKDYKLNPNTLEQIEDDSGYGVNITINNYNITNSDVTFNNDNSTQNISVESWIDKNPPTQNISSSNYYKKFKEETMLNPGVSYFSQILRNKGFKQGRYGTSRIWSR